MGKPILTRSTTRTPRPAIIIDGVAYIPLGVDAKHGYTVVDKEYAWLDKYKWTKTHDNYVTGRVNNATIGIHTIVANTPKGKLTDHIDMNPLNNRSSNLRVCDKSENMRNRGLQKNNTSGYTGVYFDKSVNRWRAEIKLYKKKIYIGIYKTPEEAAEAYNHAAIQVHGEFARLNTVL